MSNKNRWTIESAIEFITKNGGKVAVQTKVINVTEPGLAVLGAMDFLINSHKFVWKREL